MLRQGVLNTTLCDKVCQWLAAGRWFSLGTLVSSTNKTDRHDIAEILLKVGLNTITLTHTFNVPWWYLKNVYDFLSTRQICCMEVYLKYEWCTPHLGNTLTHIKTPKWTFQSIVIYNVIIFHMNWVPITAQVVSRIPTHNRGYLIHLYVKNLAVTNCGKFYALQFPSTTKNRLP